MILISEVADAPAIMGISKPAGLKSPCGEVKIVNPIFVGIDVSSKNKVAYLIKPDGSLGQFQRKIHVLNPKQVQKFEEAYPDLPKNDWGCLCDCRPSPFRQNQQGGLSYRLPVTVNNSVNQAIAVSTASMQALEKRGKILDKALNTSLRSFETR